MRLTGVHPSTPILLARGEPQPGHGDPIEVGDLLWWPWGWPVEWQRPWDYADAVLPVPPPEKIRRLPAVHI